MAFSREGFTIDVVGWFLDKTLLNLYLTLPVAAAISWLLKYPEFAPPGTADHTTSTLTPSAAKLLWTLAGLGTALATNRFLNKWTANNWTRTSPGDWNWDKEMVLITGGSSGVGASIAQKLLARNPRTTIIILDHAPLSWTPPPDTLHKTLHYRQVDLSSPAQIKALCALIKSTIGHPTVLINNAGMGRGKPLLSCTYADITAPLNTNLVASFLLVREFLPEMVRTNHGHVVHTGSMSAIVSPPRAAEYSASKAGIASLHEALQLEIKHVYGAPKVRTTLGVFGYIDTPMFHGASTGVPHFLYPLLHVDSVGEAFVEGLYSGYGRTFYLPGMMRYTAAVRGFPEWVLTPVRETAIEGTSGFKVPRQEVDEETGRVVRNVY